MEGKTPGKNPQSQLLAFLTKLNRYLIPNLKLSVSFTQFLHVDWGGVGFSDLVMRSFSLKAANRLARGSPESRMGS